MHAVKELTDNEVVRRTEVLRGKEKEVLHRLLVHFGEIDSRKLYRDIGYPSLFVYLTEGLHYSKAAAYRRVEGARFLRENPELYRELESGALTFSSLVELSKCKKSEKLKELVAESRGQSLKAVTERVAKEVAPTVSAKPKERVRVVKVEPSKPLPLMPTQSSTSSAAEPQVEAVEVSFQGDAEFMKLYQEAKAVAGGMSMSQVMKRVLKDYIQRNSPKEKMKRREERRQKSQSRKASVSSPTSRHIPVAARDEVTVRDDCQCTYVSPNGTRCSEITNLQVDHIKPYALGGSHEPSNLRLLCQSHNQLAAERVYGKEFMNQYQQRSRGSSLPLPMHRLMRA